MSLGATEPFLLLAQTPQPIVPANVQRATATIVVKWKGKAVQADGKTIQVDSTTSVGFLLSERQVICAAHAIPHVADDSLQIDCVFNHNVRVGAKLEKLDRARDLALLRLSVAPPGIAPLKLFAGRLQANLQIATVYASRGLSGEDDYPISPGTIAKVTPRNADVRPAHFTGSMARTSGSGSSGAPVVLTPSGDVVGVTLGLHQRRPSNNGPDANPVDTLVAIDAAEIQAFLDAAPAPRQAASSWVTSFPNVRTVTTPEVGQLTIVPSDGNVAPAANQVTVLNFPPQQGVAAPNVGNPYNVIPANALFANYRTLASPPMPVGPFQIPQPPMAMMFFGSDKGFNDPPGFRLGRNFGAGFTTLVAPCYGRPTDELDVMTRRLKTVFTDQRNGRVATIVTRQLQLNPANNNVNVADLLVEEGIRSRQQDLGLYLPTENAPVGTTVVVPGFLEGLQVPDAINPAIIRTFNGIWNTNNQYAHAFRHYEANGRSWVAVYMCNRPQQRLFTAWFECPTAELQQLQAPPALRPVGLSEQVLLLLSLSSDR